MNKQCTRYTQSELNSMPENVRYWVSKLPAKPPMNPKLQESGRKGGTAGKGASKVRPLTPSKASEMARARWRKEPNTHKYGTAEQRAANDATENAGSQS